MSQPGGRRVSSEASGRLVRHRVCATTAGTVISAALVGCIPSQLVTISSDQPGDARIRVVGSDGSFTATGSLDYLVTRRFFADTSSLEVSIERDGYQLRRETLRREFDVMMASLGTLGALVGAGILFFVGSYRPCKDVGGGWYECSYYPLAIPGAVVALAISPLPWWQNYGYKRAYQFDLEPLPKK